MNESLDLSLFLENEKITSALSKCSAKIQDGAVPLSWGTLELVVAYYRILRDITAHPRLEVRLKPELASFREKIHTAQEGLSKVLGLDGSYNLPEGIYVGYEDCVICSRALKLSAWQMTACLAIFGEAKRDSLAIELKQQFSSCFGSNPERFKFKSVRHLQSKYGLDSNEANYLYNLVIKRF